MLEMNYCILHPEAPWESIGKIFGTCSYITMTPEQEGFIRLTAMGEIEYLDDMVIECTKDSEFILPSGDLLGVFA